MADKSVNPKVTAAAAAAAAVTVAAWVASMFGLGIPNEVQGSITVLAVFAAGWIKKDT